MANLIPFEGAKLPAYLKQQSANLNDELTSGVGQGFPYLSIKGKNFTLIRGDERQLLTRDVDGEEVPVNSINVVLLKANKNLSKIYYVDGYDEDQSAGKKPDCFSNDGVAPDPSSETPQSKTCASCPHNAWGSKVSESGKKGKACQDARRVAIARLDQLNDPMLVRIPPATLKPLAEYGDMLKKRGVPMQAVVTKIKFDAEMATPKLEFKPVALLDEAQYNEAVEMSKSDIVQQIIGIGIPLVVPAALAAPVVDKPNKVVLDDDDDAPPAKAEKPKAEKPKAEKPKKVKATTADDDDDGDLDSKLSKLLDSDD
jgi:hypothetical protein